MKNHNGVRRLFVSLLLIFIGTFGAYLVRTSFFTVQVQNFSMVTASGGRIVGKMYVPVTAGVNNPAPAILSCPGGNSEHVIPDSINIQLARQGYAVITYNAYKHGGSDIIQDESMGAVDMLRYLSTLDFVDSENLGAIGHTLGGSYLCKAASALPGSLKSLICMDFTSIDGSLHGFDNTTPINCAWVMAQYDEHRVADAHPTMDIDLKAVFGTDQKLQLGQMYGSREENTLRVLYTIPTISSALSFNTQAAQYIVSFFGETLSGASTQFSYAIWPWLQACRGVALAGLFLFIYSIGAVLIRKTFSGLLVTPPPLASPMRGRRIQLLFCPLITMLPFVPLYMLGKRILAPSELFPQTDTNGLAIWAAFSGFFYLGAIFLFSRKSHTDSRIPGALLYETPRRIGRAFCLALLIVGSAYTINVIVQWLFSDTFGCLYTNFSLFTPRRLLALCSYFPVFLIYFLCCSMFCAKFLYFRTSFGLGPSAKFAYFHTAGFALLLFISCLGFPLQGQLFFFPSRYAIMTIPYMLPLLPLLGILDAWCYRHTGKVYLGAFLNTMLFSWLFVATNAMFLLL